MDLTEVVSRTVARTPHPTRAGCQDDGGYTNSLKLMSNAKQLALLYRGTPHEFNLYLRMNPPLKAQHEAFSIITLRGKSIGKEARLTFPTPTAEPHKRARMCENT